MTLGCHTRLDLPHIRGIFVALGGMRLPGHIVSMKLASALALLACACYAQIRLRKTVGGKTPHYDISEFPELNQKSVTFTTTTASTSSDHCPFLDYSQQWHASPALSRHHTRSCTPVRQSLSPPRSNRPTSRRTLKSSGIGCATMAVGRARTP